MADRTLTKPDTSLHPPLLRGAGWGKGSPTQEPRRAAHLPRRHPDKTLRILTRLIPLLAAIILAAGPAAARCPRAPQPELPRAPLVIETRAGPQHFSVEQAQGSEEKACGLMFRQKLGPDEGMLFDYRPGQPAFMWMENTVIPLDMVFIAPDGRVIHLVERAVPFSREARGTPETVAGVLELPGGSIARLGIRRGDRVRHDWFGNPS